MKQIKNILAVLISLALTSCDNLMEAKKLGLTTIENKEILVENYRISEITTIHQFIDITNKRWNKKERLFEGNDGTIDSIFMNHDTIYLRSIYKDPTVYDLAAIKFGYKIILVGSHD
jgi:hypothetical protein